MDRLIKYAKGIDKALSILWIVLVGLTIVAICVLLIGIIVSTKIAENPNISFVYNSGVLKVWLNEPVLTADNLRALLGSLIVVIVIIVAITLYMIMLLRVCVKDMKNGRPFSSNMPKQIRKIAYVLLTFAVIIPATPLVPSVFLFKLYDIQRILSGAPLVEKVQFSLNYNIDLTTIFIGFIVILLSLVFEYGTKLQQESDETL